MASNDKIVAIPPAFIRLLDSLLLELVEQAFEKVNNQKEVKLGEIIKMLDRRIKLQPESAEQKKFWEMIDKIRKEHQTIKKVKNVKKKAS